VPTIGRDDVIELTTIADLRAVLDDARCAGGQVGLVPTMGFLHAGHGSLIERAAAENTLVVTTRFVNPLQFAPGEDLAAYPRDHDRDAALCEAAGCDVLFSPSVEEMYPARVVTTVSVGVLSTVMEGASRPTHFDGVATVVAKLFSIAGECRAYFGEKDFQQVAVVRRMAADLSMPVQVIGCPIVREPDGLALSSRNIYLTPEERRAAPVLHRALRFGEAMILAGEVDADAVRELMAELIGAQPLAALDYVEVADPRTLARLGRCDPPARLFGAVRFGKARLIDNIAVPADARAGGPIEP
jgi:pantoate--beta-alanine ligase